MPEPLVIKGEFVEIEYHTQHGTFSYSFNWTRSGWLENVALSFNMVSLSGDFTFDGKVWSTATIPELLARVESLYTKAVL